jgi:hypothetical protein
LKQVMRGEVKTIQLSHPKFSHPDWIKHALKKLEAAKKAKIKQERVKHTPQLIDATKSCHRTNLITILASLGTKELSGIESNGEFA